VIRFRTFGLGHGFDHSLGPPGVVTFLIFRLVMVNFLGLVGI
jgi:hypothetical protein